MFLDKLFWKKCAVALFLIGVFFYICSTRTNTDTIEKNNTSYIIHGNEVPVEYQVAIFDNNSIVFCGGTIYKKYIIITATHCFDKNNNTNISIRAGSEKYHAGGQVVGVRRIVDHWKYNKSNKDYDISLLFLVKPLTYNEKVVPIKIPKQDETVPDGTIANISGWGKTDFNNHDPNELLLMAEMKIFNQEECIKKHEGNVTDRMICAVSNSEQDQSDSCEYDSGGPLVINGTLYGIISKGSKDCKTIKFPQICTRVSAFVEWINEKIREDDRPGDSIFIILGYITLGIILIILLIVLLICIQKIYKCIPDTCCREIYDWINSKF